MKERNLYDGLFYCRLCGKPFHVFFILKTLEKCKCGNKGFISHNNINLQEIFAQTEEMIEEDGIKIS